MGYGSGDSSTGITRGGGTVLYGSEIVKNIPERVATTLSDVYRVLNFEAKRGQGLYKTNGVNQPKSIRALVICRT